MIIEGNILRPAEGYKYISNGSVWSDLVYLGRTDSADRWHDTNNEPPQPEDELTDSEALDIITGGMA